ncbi:MAG: flagellar M-ring protein FliF [Bdellovibrionales bacterium]|nr:flagellar M-ring protein FliF [Bdellovibrionales bacterium]
MKSLSPVKRFSAIASAAIFVITLIVLGLMLSGKTYVPLFTKVTADHLPIIVDKLKQMSIPFKIEEGGAVVTVPPELLHSTQMAIMTEHSDTKLGSIGLELFDHVDLGTTSYAQRVNYQRALQGELMRAINSLAVVRKSKVILALPPKKTFLEDAGETKASVIVDLFPGTTLSKAQVKGIINLVASAVENMHTNNVSVIDSYGRELSKSNTSESSAFSGELAELKVGKEKELEERIEGILSRVVGSGKVIAKVEATLNMNDTSSIEETYDAEKTAVRSIQKQEDKMNGSRNNPTGIPGARANLPGAEENGTVGFNQETNKDFSVTNYEVPKTVTKSRKAPGSIDRLSVAVLVDGVSKVEKAEDGTSKTTWAPRSEEELRKYEALVKSAIGFNEKRGDSVKIENIEFQFETFSDADDILQSIETRKLLSYVIRWSVIALSLSLFFLLVVRPFITWITESFRESVDDMLPRTIEELEELQSVDSTLPGMSATLPVLEESLDPDKAESELLKERIMGIIEKDEDKSANALKLWLIRREM